MNRALPCLRSPYRGAPKGVPESYKGPCTESGLDLNQGAELVIAKVMGGVQHLQCGVLVNDDRKVLAVWHGAGMAIMVYCSANGPTDEHPMALSWRGSAER